MKRKSEISLSSTFGARSRCPLCGSVIELLGTLSRMFCWSYKAIPRRRKNRPCIVSTTLMSSIPNSYIFRTKNRMHSTNLRFHKNEKSNGEYMSDEMCTTLCPSCLRRRGKTWAFKSSYDMKPEGVNRRCKITYNK